MTEPLTYEEAMAFIHERSGYDRGFISNPFAGDNAARLGLIRTERLLQTLGRPDRQYRVLHVAGSKGKGSTSTFLDAILRTSGLRSGRFLSPHLHRFNERFSVDGIEISDEAFASVVGRVRIATLVVEKDDPSIGDVTAWEISTAIALTWFAEAHCDVAVIEVGMGGLLDATNVVEPAASLITRLDLEHTAILGDTLAEIAVNKAGIIKPMAPAFSVAQPGEALAVLQAKAIDEGTSLAVAEQDWQASGTSESFEWTGGSTQLFGLRSNLVGRHQVENASLAIAALVSLREADSVAWPIPDEAIRSGLAVASIIGRFEVLESTIRVPVVIDGAHSPASTSVLAETLREQFPGQSVIAVVAMLADKRPVAVLSPLTELVDQWIVSTLPSPRALPAAELVSALRETGTSPMIADSVASGLDLAQMLSVEYVLAPVIVVTGSLSTAAEARSALHLTSTD